MRIRPSRNVACSEYALCTRLEMFVDSNAPIESQACVLGEFETRPDTYAHNYKVSFDRLAVFKMHDFVDCFGFGLQMKYHSVLFMQRANEIAHVGPEDAFHWPLVGCDDMDFELAGAERGSDLEPNEARADHNRPI